MLYASAVFLDVCVTVHDYKNRIKTLGCGALREIRNYHIFECYVMRYEDFIYVCNHLNEVRSVFKQSKAKENGVPRVRCFIATVLTRFFCLIQKRTAMLIALPFLYDT